MTSETGRKPDPPRRTVETGDDLDSQFTHGLNNRRWITAEALDRYDYPEMRWAIPGVLPAGTAVFAGRPKIGKSAWALILVGRET